jgi:hypothetical protein
VWVGDGTCANIEIQNLTLNDLRSDPILIRKIRRMQQAEAADAENSSDDEAARAPKRGTRQLDGSNDMPDPSSRVQIQSTQQSSIIEDLGDPSDDEQPPNSSIVEDLGDPSSSEDEL